MQVHGQRALQLAVGPSSSGTRTRLAVLGSPIAHSKSPALHAAAYRVLGLPWDYSAIEITAPQLPGFIESLDDRWRGLSLTMPLKRDILALLDSRDALVELTGVANTVVFSGAGLSGFNTDVYGVSSALRGRGIGRASVVHLLGAGATAASVLVAIAGLDAEKVLLSARSPEKIVPLRRLAERLGLLVVDVSDDEGPAPDLVVSTLPGGASLDVQFTPDVLASAAYLDVAYEPWPTPLATRFLDAGGQVIPGLEMLVGQALAQVRVFVSGGPDVELDREAEVLAAMRASVGLTL